LVFTGGIGEHSASIRASSCASLGFLGLSLDAGLNASPTLDCDVAGPESTARILLITAREDAVAARAARDVLRTGQRRDALQ
jgi:acetate kinase